MLTAAEQFFLEQVNRARLNPEGEAERFGIGLNDPDPTGNPGQPPSPPIASGVRQPLAANAALSQASDLQANAYLDGLVRLSGEGAGHWWNDAGSIYFQPSDRAEEFGYGSRFVGENLSYSATTAAYDSEEAVLWGGTGIGHHQGLFYSITHRPNLLNGDYKEAGIAQVLRDDHVSGGMLFTASTLTNKFGTVDFEGRFLTGVAYADSDGDGFYSLGEGVAGVTITVGAQNAGTASAGGYALDLGAQAEPVSVQIDWQGQSLMATLGFAPEGWDNVKLDIVGGTRLLASTDLTLGAGVVEGGLLGAGRLSLTGNAADNLLLVGRGENMIDGAGGVNTAQFTGSFSAYQITALSDHVIVSDLRGTALGDGVNTLSNFAYLRFADGQYDLATGQFMQIAPAGQLTLKTSFGAFMSGAERNGGAMLSGMARDLPEGTEITVTLGALSSTVRTTSGQWQAWFSPADLAGLDEGRVYQISATGGGVSVTDSFGTSFTAPQLAFFPAPFDRPLTADDLETGLIWRGVTSATEGQVIITLAGIAHEAMITPRQGDADRSHEWEVHFPEASLRALEHGVEYVPQLRLIDQFENAYSYNLTNHRFTADLDFPEPDPAPEPEPGDGVALAVTTLDGAPLEGGAVTFTPQDGTTPTRMTTDTAGQVRLDLTPGAAGQISAARDWSPETGDPSVTALDALEVLRMAVGLAPAFGVAQAAHFIAADITRDGRVDALDALDILRAAVGIATEHAPEWVFFDAATEWDTLGLSAANTHLPDGLPLEPGWAGADLALTGILLGNISDVS